MRKSVEYNPNRMLYYCLILCQEVDGLKAYAVNIHLEEQHRSLPHEEKC